MHVRGVDCFDLVVAPQAATQNISIEEREPIDAEDH